MTRQMKRQQKREVDTIVDQAMRGTYVAPAVSRGARRRANDSVDAAKKVLKRLEETQGK